MKLLDKRWDLARGLISRPNSLTPYVKAMCFKISEGFDRVSILFVKCDADERETRFAQLREMLEMRDDEKMTFKSYATFMKLHGWERLDVDDDSEGKVTKKEDESKRSWIIGTMNTAGTFLPTIPPIKAASLNDQLTKFKKEANFADLANLTGNG